MTTIINGLLGGLVAGFVAVLAVRVVADAPSIPTLSERAVGSSFPSSRWTRAVVRILYGGLAGGVLVALELFALYVLAVPPSIGAAFGLAVAWSAFLFALLAVVRRAVAPESFGRSLRPLFVYHLVYGLAFGAWIRLTWIT